MTDNSNDKTATCVEQSKFLHKPLLTNQQVESLCKAFANNFQLI